MSTLGHLKVDPSPITCTAHIWQCPLHRDRRILISENSNKKLKGGGGVGFVLLYMGFKQFTLETSLLYKPERLGLE